MSIHAKMASLTRRKLVRFEAVSLVMALGVFTLATPVRAADISLNRSRMVNASFSSTDPSGCITANVLLFATKASPHDPPGPVQPLAAVSLSIYQFDNCTGATLLSAGSSGFVTIPKDGIQVLGRSDSATLSTTLEVFDFVSNTPLSVNIDLTWTATGDPTHMNERSLVQSPGSLVLARYSSIARESEASGSVSVGGTNFTPEPSVSAGIASVQNGQVTTN
jgi:hypothetical protein